MSIALARQQIEDALRALQSAAASLRNAQSQIRESHPSLAVTLGFDVRSAERLIEGVQSSCEGTPLEVQP